MDKENKSVLLGELLTKAGLLTNEMLEEALKRAHETRLPLGKILVWSDYLNESQLHAAIEAQSLINDRLLTISDAVRALNMISDQKDTLDIALDELGWSPSELFQRNRLGDLMLAAGMVSDEQLDESLTAALSTGLPLGQVLACSPAPLNLHVRSALTAQAMIREGKIDRLVAIDALKLAKQHQVTFEQGLLELGVHDALTQNNLELSELLLGAGVITQAKTLRAVEYSLCANKPIGECLVELGFVTEDTLLAAKTLRESANHGEITRSLAAQALRRVHDDGLNTSRALAVEADRAAGALPQITATDLLRLASFVTKGDLEKVLPQGDVTTDDAADVPLSTTTIDEKTFATILQCLDQIERGSIDLQQAIVILHLCLRRNLSLPESLATLGITLLS